MIKLIVESVEYDISAYIDESSIVYSDNIDETKAHGGFSIPFIKPNEIVKFDMSKSLDRLMQVVIDIDGEVTYWKISEDRVDLVRKGTTPLYSHEISLIEPTVDLENRPLPDMTVTQPKGSLDNYIYTINAITGEEDIIGSVEGSPIEASYEQTGVKVVDSLTTLDFNYGISNDITVIDETELLEVRPYTMQLNYTIYNIQYIYPYDSPEGELELTVYADGTLIETFTTEVLKADSKWTLFGGTVILPRIKTDNKSFVYTPSSTGEVITVKARTTGEYVTVGSTIHYDELWITELGFNILTFDEGETSKIMLDNVVDKILLISPSSAIDNPTQEFTLADVTRSRISTTVSPEFTFKGYTMYDALNEVASYVGAIVYLGEDDYTTVYFHFYDDVGIEGNIEYLEEEQNVYLTDYVTALEINAQNVINEDNERYALIEPSETGWMSIRTTDIGEITDDNATLHTSRPYYKSFKLLAKGLAFEMLDGATPVTFLATVEWDISDFVVEKTKWNALENQALDSRSGILNKGNTVYYSQGQKMLYNLGYNDVILAPAWNKVLPANYAIVEAILCQAAVENPTYTFASDYQPTISLFDMLFRIYYMPYSNARVTVYRDDAARLNKAVKYFNEQASINDMKSLGDIAKRHANRKGNPISTYKGITTNIYNLIKLGMKNDRDEILSSYEIVMSPLLREFVLHYSKDNPNISAYKGTPSAYRQYEIPVDDLVFRKDKYSEFVYFSETDDDSIYTIYTSNQILANFKPIPDGDKLTYAVIELDYTGAGYTETVEATVDTLAFGNTLAIQIEMQDNYSAGAKQVDGVVYDGSAGGISQTRQADTPYGDELGRVENIKISTYITHAVTSDNYPDNDTSISGEQSVLELVVKKDAREIWGLTQELVFRSDYSSITIFSGMAKFNGLVAKGSTVESRPLLLKKGYFPINESIDFTKTIQTSWDSTVTDNELYTEIDAPAGSYEGYIWMEMSNNTPIFAVRTTEFDSLTAATNGHSIFYNISYEKIVSNYTTELDNTVTITDSIAVTRFIFPVLTVSETFTMTDTINVIKSTNIVVDLLETIAMTASVNVIAFEFPVLTISETFTVSDVIVAYKSQDIVIDLTETLSVHAAIAKSASSQFLVPVSNVLTLTDTIDAYRSTNTVVDLEETISVTASINDVSSTTYVEDISETFTVSDSISVSISTDVIVDLEDTITVTRDISESQITANWVYIGTSGSYDKTVTYVASGSLCAPNAVIDAWLETTYPATDYAYGYVIRVARGNEDLYPCSPIAYYYQAS